KCRSMTVSLLSWRALQQPPTVVVTSCFFFQAEDGIRDLTVTGVQTCALPILRPRHGNAGAHRKARSPARRVGLQPAAQQCRAVRSEERRVGKECRCRWWA